MFYWIQTSPSASAIVQPNQTITTIQHTNIKHLTSIFLPIFYYIKRSKVVSFKGVHIASIPQIYTSTTVKNYNRRITGGGARGFKRVLLGPFCSGSNCLVHIRVS